MTTSTITNLAPTATASTPTPSVAGRPADLVRLVDGVHLPVAGPWEIATGQRVALRTRGLRRRELAARVAGGSLCLTGGLLDSTLQFTVTSPELPSSLVVSVRVTGQLGADIWRAEGAVTSTDGSSPVSVRLRCNGVFRQRGRRPVLWLTVEAMFDRTNVRAELNLHPTAQGQDRR